MAALDVIVREAGGRFTSLDGTDGPLGGNALATNGHLHDAALSFLGSVPDDDGDPDWQPSGPGLGVRAAAAAAARRSTGTDPTTDAGSIPSLSVPCSAAVGLATVGGSTPSRRCSDADRRSAQGQARARRGHDQPDAGVRELIAQLAEHNVGALIVSSDGETVDGIVSERDVVRHLHHDGTVVNNTVGAIMTEVVETCEPGQHARRPDGGHDRAPDPARARGRRRQAGRHRLIGDVVKHRMSQLEFERDQLDSYVHQT